MTFSTPPNSPSKFVFQTPNASAARTPTRTIPSTPLGQAAQSLGNALTDRAGLSVASMAPAEVVSTPGRLSSIQDPINNNTNQIQSFPKDFTAYRADNSYNHANCESYSRQFFTVSEKDAKSHYGDLVLKFTLNKDVKLLRLDKCAEGFRHWLKNTDQFQKEEKDILYNNFGYPRDGSANASDESHNRLRCSNNDKDKTMLKMIQSYSQEIGGEIDGYYNSPMNTEYSGDFKTEDGKTSLFHAEFAVFDGGVFSKPVVTANYSERQFESLNNDAKEKQHSNDLKMARKNKRPRPG